MNSDFDNKRFSIAVMVEELEAFEQALPPGAALRIYEQHQASIREFPLFHLKKNLF